MQASEDGLAIGKKRGRPREFDKEQALCKALGLFWSKGYEQATIAALSEAMGIASPSIYCAFGNKRDLFLQALAYYRKIYWQPAFARYAEAPEIHVATATLFAEAARTLLAPNAPCGCLTVITALCLPENDGKINAAIRAMRDETRQMFRNKLKMAVNKGQIPAESNIPAICGALTNFLEGLALQARGDICLSELLDIASLGVRLLPVIKE